MQTCRGSHTHTLVVDPKDKNNVYIYVSGTSFVRQDEELAGVQMKHRIKTRTPRYFALM